MFLRILSRVGIKALRKKKTYLEWKVYSKASNCRHEWFRWTKCFLKAQCFTHGATAPLGPGSPHCWGFTITLKHTTVGRAPLVKWSARRRDLYPTTNKTKKKRQPSMLPAGLEPAIPASERLQTHALGSAPTGIGTVFFKLLNLFIKSTEMNCNCCQ